VNGRDKSFDSVYTLVFHRVTIPVQYIYMQN